MRFVGVLQQWLPGLLRMAVANVTNNKYGGWVKNEHSTHIIWIAPHESFASV